ncbi:MAG: PEP-CTERM sorting domain-containing protein [Planctomycetota bacterium]
MTRTATGCIASISALSAACLLAPGASAANIVLFNGGGDFFSGVPGGFAFEDFAGAVTETPTSLILDIATDTNAANGLFGGLGRDLTQADFDPSAHQFRVVYRQLADNAANDFRIILRDNDGDDSGPGLGSEDYQFFVDMSFAAPLGDGSGFDEQFVPLTLFGNPVFRAQSFGFANDGDTILNPGANQWQVQSPFGGQDRLNIEIATIEIIPIPEPASLSALALGATLLGRRRRRA